MNALELTIPAPCDWLNSNQRLHWAEKARRVKAWRERTIVAVFAGDTLPRFDVPVHITCTVHKTRGGRWDAGNLADTAKPIVDGLVSAGVLVDDSNEWVTGPDMRAGEKRDAACVVVRVEAIA